MYFRLREILENNIEYELLPIQCFLLTFWGIWTPKNWSIQVKNFNRLFFIFVFSLDFLICTEMTIYFFNTIGTDNFKLINFFFVSANITGVYKAIKLRQNVEKFRSFIRSYFNQEWIFLQNSDEIYIHEENNSIIKRVTLIYAASMVGIVCLKAMSPLLQSSDVPLPVDAWYPYPVEKSKWFWITYVHQVILGSSAVSAHIGVDTLIVGLLLKTICQMKILKCRILNLSNVKDCKKIEKYMIIQLIKHHARIYRFGKDLNKKFRDILIILVISSLPNICINVYTLSAYTNNIDIQYFATFFSTTSAFLQFFIVCWFGNEVKLNSIQIRSVFYEMDWTTFSVSSRKLLIFMMTRTVKPIQLSFAYVIPMNLDSFITIIKTSYTTFNLLQRKANPK